MSFKKEHEVEVYDHTGGDFRVMMHFGNWRVAYLNHGERFKEENFNVIERHMETDEVFVLLQGSAELIIGKELHRIKMEPFKIYNVPKGVWHHIFTQEGTRVLIVEEYDTSDENSEYYTVK